jgi:hypothetical protein
VDFPPLDIMKRGSVLPVPVKCVWPDPCYIFIQHQLVSKRGYTISLVSKLPLQTGVRKLKKPMNKNTIFYAEIYRHSTPKNKNFDPFYVNLTKKLATNFMLIECDHMCCGRNFCQLATP